MTREESIEIIQKLIGRFKSDSRTYKALEMAIQALSQEPCDDAISRDAVLNAICDYVAFEEYEDKSHTFTIMPLTKRIKQLPSVTQKSETVTEFADRCRECGKRYVKIPDNATNGDVIKALFHNIKYEEGYVYVKSNTHKNVIMTVREDWWNAPYQKGGK